MKLLNVSPFKVGRRYKSIDNDFWCEVLSIAEAGAASWKMEYTYQRESERLGTDKATVGAHLTKYYVEVPKDETVE